MEKTINNETKTQGVETQAVKKETVTFKTIKAWIDGYNKMLRAGLADKKSEETIREVAREAINKLGGL